jgi:hypothetical protein
MVVLPRRGGYWVEGAGSESPPEFSSLSNCNNTGTMPKPKIDQDETAKAYRKYFHGKVSSIHLNPSPSLTFRFITILPGKISNEPSRPSRLASYTSVHL